MFESSSNIEDRKAFATRKDHDSSDWSLSTGAHRGTAEAARAKRFPIRFGLDGIDTC